MAPVAFVSSQKTLHYVLDTSIDDLQTSTMDLGDGTAFLITSSGLLLTNRHVVADPKAQYIVRLYDGSNYIVDKIWYHPDLDLALLQIKKANESGFPHNLPYVPLATIGGKFTIGDQVWVIGALFSHYPVSMTAGIISQTGLTLKIADKSYQNMILTDALVSYGNSGGPMYNKY
ncbi:MAG: serine protease [bacterium]|nr:serine protease [bacterium]